MGIVYAGSLVPFTLLAFETEIVQATRVSVTGSLRVDETRFSLTVEIQDPTHVLKLPSALGTKPGELADELWKTTCAELFVSAGDDRYLELNFGPDGRWNAYVFDRYRERAKEKPGVHLSLLKWEKIKIGTRVLAVGQLPFVPKEFNATFVADVGRGVIHFASKHPAEKPDFHQREYFLHATRD